MLVKPLAFVAQVEAGRIAQNIETAGQLEVRRVIRVIVLTARADSRRPTSPCRAVW